MYISTLHQILWVVGIFAIGMLAGYMLKVVLVNRERIKVKPFIKEGRQRQNSILNIH